MSQYSDSWGRDGLKLRAIDVEGAASPHGTDERPGGNAPAGIGHGEATFSSIRAPGRDAAPGRDSPPGANEKGSSQSDHEVVIPRPPAQDGIPESVSRSWHLKRVRHDSSASLDEDSSEMTSPAAGMSWRAAILFYVGTVLVNLPRFLIQYLGVITFCYVFLLVFLSCVLSIAIYITAAMIRELMQGLLWLIYTIPFWEYVMVMTQYIADRVFSQDTWENFGFRATRRFLNSVGDFSLKRFWFMFTLLLLYPILICPVAFHFTHADDKFRIASIIVGVYSVLFFGIETFAAVFLPLLRPAYAVFCGCLMCCGGEEMEEDPQPRKRTSRDGPIEEPPKIETPPEPEGPRFEMELGELGWNDKNSNADPVKRFGDPLGILVTAPAYYAYYQFLFKFNPCKPQVELGMVELHVPKIIAIGLFFAIQVLDIQNVLNNDGSGVYLGIRITLCFLALPFMLFGAVWPWTIWRDLKKMFPRMLRAKKTILVLLAILTVCFIVLGSWIQSAFKPKLLTDLNYSEETRNNLGPHNNWMCGIEVGGWSLLELAGLSMAGQTISDPAITNQTLQYLLGNSGWEIDDFGRNQTIPLILIQRNSSQPVLVIQGIVRRRSVGMVIENILGYYFEKFVEAMIPFFGWTRELFLSDFPRLACRWFIDAFIGFMDISSRVFSESQEIAEQVEGETGEFPLFVGHMNGGLIAKALSVHNKGQSIAFESQDLGSSLLIARVKTNDWSGNEILNIHSDDSFFAFPEFGLSQNVKLPTYHAFWAFVTPYQTFCVIAAGCADDDRYDHICTTMVGKCEYARYHEVWGRARDPDTSV